MRALKGSGIRTAFFMGAVLVAAALTPPGAAWATVLPDFGAASFVPGAPIDNPYFPLNQPLRRIYVAQAVGGGDPVNERFVQSNIGRGLTILGVPTEAQLDRAFEDGLLVEETFDYFAQDTVGNVWYFGEDVTEFVYDDQGNLIETNHDGSWRAGVNGAKPGFALPVDQTIGFNYFQEFAPADNALDEATTLATGLTLPTAFGTLSDVIKVLETSQLEPGVFEAKYYAPGIGLVLEEEGLDANGQNPTLAARLVAIQAIPEPASWAMLIVGFGAIGASARLRTKARQREAVA
jgi:hypothetical protein